MQEYDLCQGDITPPTVMDRKIENQLYVQNSTDEPV